MDFKIYKPAFMWSNDMCLFILRRCMKPASMRGKHLEIFLRLMTVVDHRMVLDRVQVRRPPSE